MGDIQLRAGGYLEHGTHRFAGTLKFNVLKAGDLSFAEGDIVRFSADGQLQFYGWVFTKSKDPLGGDSGHMLRPHPLSEGQRIL